MLFLPYSANAGQGAGDESASGSSQIFRETPPEYSAQMSVRARMKRKSSCAGKEATARSFRRRGMRWCSPFCCVVTWVDGIRLGSSKITANGHLARTSFIEKEPQSYISLLPCAYPICPKFSRTCCSKLAQMKLLSQFWAACAYMSITILHTEQFLMLCGIVR